MLTKREGTILLSLFVTGLAIFGVLIGNTWRNELTSKKADLTEAETEAEQSAIETGEADEISEFPTFSRVAESEAEVETEEPEKETEVVAESTQVEAPMRTIYGIDGNYISGQIYDYIEMCLKRYGIEWMMPIAVCEAWQESRFITDAVSDDGMDKGLFQFREIYWGSRCDSMGYVDGADRCIFNAYSQAEIYAKEMAERLASGKTLEEAVSDHFTGGCGFNATYVNDVMKWQDHLTIKEAKGYE